MVDSKRGTTLRDAIGIALEGLPGSIDCNVLDMKDEDIRQHLIGFIKDFGKARGVVFEDSDVMDEINTRLRELRGIAIARTRTPR